MLRLTSALASLLVVVLLLLVVGETVNARQRQRDCANGMCSLPTAIYQLALPQEQPQAKAADFCSGCTCLTCRCVLGECGQQFVSAGDVTSMLAPTRQSFLYSLPAETSIDRRPEGRRSRSGFLSKLFGRLRR